MQRESIPPPKLCECGCGKPTLISAYTFVKRGWVRGQPRRFLQGHNNRKFPPSHPGYEVQDRGFKTPCWVWVRGKTGDGYGYLSEHGQRLGRAHRVLYERLRGPVAAGLELDHLCRVPLCVNPDHLEPVSTAENTRRGLVPKLSLADAGVIRGELQRGTRPIDLARRFGVGASTIHNIKSDRTWT